MTRPNPYSRFNRDQLILRDVLAADRTILANERTFLAYIRTALTFFVAGVTFIKFFDHILIEIVGYIFIPLGLIILIIGFIRYIKMYRVLSILHQKEESTDAPATVIQPSKDIES